jgi:hypothetical protein
LSIKFLIKKNLSNMWTEAFAPGTVSWSRMTRERAVSAQNLCAPPFKPDDDDVGPSEKLRRCRRDPSGQEANDQSGVVR